MQKDLNIFKISTNQPFQLIITAQLATCFFKHNCLFVVQLFFVFIRYFALALLYTLTS